MRNALGREADDALVHRLHGIRDDVSDRVREGFLVDFDLGQVARKKIFGAHHRAAQHGGDGFLHRGLERDAHLGLRLLGRDGKHLLDEIARALQGALHFIKADGDRVVRAV